MAEVDKSNESTGPSQIDNEGKPVGNQPVDITDKHFDAHASEGGAWVADEAPLESDNDEKSESEMAPGDRLAEERAEDHNENATEGR